MSKPERTKPRAILFDLDDTILPGFARPDVAWREVVAALVDTARVDAVVEAIRAHSREFWADPERHRQWRMTMPAARRRIVTDACAALAATGHAAPDVATAEEIADRFTGYLDDAISILPDASHVLDELRRRGLRLALITNCATAPQRAKIERFDLAHRFDHVQIEEEAGVGKPEPAAYLRAMAKLGVAASETWMVGDNLEWEVVAPQRLGIFAVWADLHGRGLPPGGDVRPDMIVRTLSDLLPALG